MKVCSKCRVPKPLSAFFMRKDSKDGRRGACRLCMGQAHTAYRKTPQGKATAHKHNVSDKGRASQVVRSHRHWSKHPNRLKARIAVGHALRDEHLLKQPCENCGDLQSEAHHESYEIGDWLKVNWLCLAHHRARHAELKLT